MYDFESRRIIEALRSGIPSREVGKYFTEARPQIMRQLSDRLEKLREDGQSGGMIVTGKYGEGKTHLLNTVWNMAQDSNMVVSYLSLSKETPFDKMYLVYQKVMANTYLPGRKQPGIAQLFDEMSANSPVAGELMLYASKELQTDKLYYLLKAFLNTKDSEEKFQLEADLEGDFAGNPVVRKIYKRIFGQTVRFNVNFSRTKHVMDYFAFMSRLFRLMNYDGWVILVDEAELIGRLGKKARLNSYRNMSYFLLPQAAGKQHDRLEKQPPETKYVIERADLDHVFALFAVSSSYAEDVIEGKHELRNLEETYPDTQEVIRSVIDEILQAQQLQPLAKSEIREIITRMQTFHAKAYDWTPDVSADAVMRSAENQGFLLRTKLRAAIEFFDQLYQYGEAGDIRTGELGKEDYSEDSTPSLEELDD